MSKNQLSEYYEDLDDFNLDETKPSQKFVSRKRESKRHETDVKLFVRAQEIAREFQFTYKAARFEEAWLLGSLVEIAEHQWITDVLRKVKAGKEASVYQCLGGKAANGKLVAAKVYRPRSLRNLKNDHQYRVGRVDLDEDGNALTKKADIDAIIKRTAYGEEVRHRSWIAYEYKTLEMLSEAGADVPHPYAVENNAILMGFIGDLDESAPTLNSVSLGRDEAKSLFERVIHNIDLMLNHDRIHGDLSAYNILYWDGQITLIDFPQVVLPKQNPAAWTIFLRDVTRICQYFSSQGFDADARRIASELWISHGFRINKEIHPRDLDADKVEDRTLWEMQKNQH